MYSEHKLSDEDGQFNVSANVSVDSIFLGVFSINHDACEFGKKAQQVCHLIITGKITKLSNNTKSRNH